MLPKRKSGAEGEIKLQLTLNEIDSMNITSHAKRRMRTRAGIENKLQHRQAILAYMKGKEVKRIDPAFTHTEGKRFKIISKLYKNCIYIYDGNVLITVLKYEQEKWRNKR